MNNITINKLFQEAVYSKEWTNLYNHLDVILKSPNVYLKDIENYCSTIHSVSYFLNHIAKNNKRQLERILNYHVQLISHINEHDKNKCQALLSKLYLHFKNIPKEYFFEASLTKKDMLNEFFKSVSQNGKEMFDKIKKEQNIDFFINQEHKHHQYSLKESLVHYLLTYEKIPFRKLIIIAKDIWSILPDDSHPVDIKKIQENLKPEGVRLYNFQNFPLPYKKEFNQTTNLIIFKTSFNTNYKNTIFWHEFLMGVTEIFQLHSTNRTPNGQTVKTMLDLVKAYHDNEFVREVFPFFAKQKAQNAKTEKNKSLWQACLFELTLEEPNVVKKRFKI
jgi:hypothetical protein